MGRADTVRGRDRSAGPGDPAFRLAGVVLDVGDVTVLDGVDAEIARGRVCVVVGASGAGKSSLLRMLAGVLSPTSGRLDRCPSLLLGQWWPGRGPGLAAARVTAVRDALAAGPEALLLDEPTEPLMPRESAPVTALLERAAASGTCVVVASHDRRWVRAVADDVLLLREGSLVRTDVDEVDFLAVHQATMTRLLGPPTSPGTC